MSKGGHKINLSSFSDKIENKSSCDCVNIRSCKWSLDGLKQLKGLQQSNPKYKSISSDIKKHICNKKTQTVYCCGPVQQPPSKIKVFSDKIENESSCDCVNIRSCKWSLDALKGLKGLEENDPKYKSISSDIKKHICNNKTRTIYCCGPEQHPPSKKEVFSGELNYS